MPAAKLLHDVVVTIPAGTTVNAVRTPEGVGFYTPTDWIKLAEGDFEPITSVTFRLGIGAPLIEVAVGDIVDYRGRGSAVMRGWTVVDISPGSPSITVTKGRSRRRVSALDLSEIVVVGKAA